jgi:hypothetical protein
VTRARLALWVAGGLAAGVLVAVAARQAHASGASEEERPAEVRRQDRSRAAKDAAPRSPAPGEPSASARKKRVPPGVIARAAASRRAPERDPALAAPSASRAPASAPAERPVSIEIDRHASDAPP